MCDGPGVQGMGWPMAEEGQAPHMVGKPFGGAAAVAHGSVLGGQGSLLSGGSGNSGATGFLAAPHPPAATHAPPAL